jgi:hypothetical protein
LLQKLKEIDDNASRIEIHDYMCEIIEGVIDGLRQVEKEYRQGFIEQSQGFSSRQRSPVKEK